MTATLEAIPRIAEDPEVVAATAALDETRSRIARLDRQLEEARQFRELSAAEAAERMQRGEDVTFTRPDVGALTRELDALRLREKHEQNALSNAKARAHARSVEYFAPRVRALTAKAAAQFRGLLDDETALLREMRAAGLNPAFDNSFPGQVGPALGGWLEGHAQRQRKAR